ncbi:hypothetical protein BS47DRAFT_1380866 [Hydnum rufescens UP504]|uniref:Uncharacterized protein n=1 Tax=Hydnum rufescens UP504 TaxID=1448309 RepID=A0A9P6B5F0_9AGAM|nr:hypothetical protein BS47DRAFT_1380866 [Hydnum rufescens UP504]
MERAKRDAKTRQEILGPKNRPQLYGDDVPYSRLLLPEYITTRLEASASAAGLEVYKDEENDNTVFVCGGKVLVLDVTLLNHTRSGLSNDSMPTISLTSLKISHALPTDDTPVHGPLPSDTLLSALLASDVNAFAPEGVRWLREIGLVAADAENITRQEAKAVATQLSLSYAPLDIFLRRGHPLPLPHLTRPTLTFLIEISPRAYLTLLRGSQRTSLSDQIFTPEPFDVRLPDIRSFVASRLSHRQTFPVYSSESEYLFSIATLSLSPNPTVKLLGPEGLGPSYHLLQSQPTAHDSSNDAIKIDTLPSIDPIIKHTFPSRVGETWILDFSICSASGVEESSETGGIWMRQSAIKEIARIVGISPGMSAEFLSSGGLSDDTMSLGVNVGYGHLEGSRGVSWFDCLVERQHPVPSAQYMARVNVPSHPSLQFTTAASTDPGFALGRVPVASMRQVHAVLEIVRDHCWINHFLRTANWRPENYYGPPIPDFSSLQDDMPDLDSVLSGAYIPNFIPVTLDVQFSALTTKMALVFPLPFPASRSVHCLLPWTLRPTGDCR